MKKLLLILLPILLLYCKNNETEEKLQFVYDYENVFTDVEENKLDSLLRNYEKETTNEIVIVSTHSYYPGDNILSFATEFYNTKGIGKKSKDNGIVIVVSKTMHQLRISTGYGIEGTLKDEIVKNIINEKMLPEFRKGNYYSGVIIGVEIIIKNLKV